MKYSNLTATIRDVHGRGASRRLRRSGVVPGIIYGSNVDATSISLDHNTIFHALKREEFHTSLLNIEVNGKVEKVLLRDFQLHSYRPEVLHVDFQRVNEKEEIQIYVPLHFVNEDTAYAVKIQGAHITHVITEVEIRALAKDIPHFIEIDLQNIKAGETIHLSDLLLPTGVTLTSLIRGDDATVVIAAGISEEVEGNENLVSASDIPTVSGKKSEYKE